MVLRLDTCNLLIARVGFYACLKGSIKLGEDGPWEESYLKFAKGLLFLMFSDEGNIFYYVDQVSCRSTVVDNKSTVTISKA